MKTFEQYIRQHHFMNNPQQIRPTLGDLLIEKHLEHQTMQKTSCRHSS
jgi:hypothetical protein